MDRDFKIEIKDEKEAAQEFINVWKKAERGEMPEKPIERVYFRDLQTLTSLLTEKRLEILKMLHESGAMSIRALSKHLHRDYKNVHQDIQLLVNVGLVEKTEEGLVSVPWDTVVAEIRLAA
jgi:predicted transcriptional regulator